jgi:hypothetical protein
VTEHDREALQDKYRQQIPGGEGDDKFHELTEEQLRDKVIGKEGFASTRIRSHYGDPNDVPQMTPEEANKEVDLSTPEAREKALGGMRQNANPLDPNGGMQCGASALVGGALYGGGNDGIKMLLQAEMADRAKEKISDKDPKAPWMSDDLKKIMAKLNDPNAKLTQGELATVQSKTYDQFQAENLTGKKDADPNDPLNGGLNGKKLNDFIGRHKDIQKMFADKDMGLDSIDLNGDGKGDHLVLGIGHEHNMESGKQSRSMVFDPQARQDKRDSGDYMSSDSIEKLNTEERAKLQGEWDRIGKIPPEKSADYEAEYDKLSAKQAVNVKTRQFAYKNDTQLIKGDAELADYRKATDYEANGNPKVRDLNAQTKAENPYDWYFR